MSNARENVNLLTSADWDIATLRLANWGAGAVPPQVILKNNHVAGDGGGLFRYDASDTTTADNGGTVIVDAAGNRWKRQFDGGTVYLTWWGNNATALQAAFDFIETSNIVLRLFIPNGTYTIASTCTYDQTTLGHSITIEGEDQLETILSLHGVSHERHAGVYSWTAADQRANRLVIRNLAMTTAVANAGAAIKSTRTASAVVAPNALFEDIYFYQTSSGYWTYDIWTIDASDTWFNRLYGMNFGANTTACVFIDNNLTTQSVFGAYFTECSFNGALYNVRTTGQLESLYLNNCSLVGARDCVSLDATSTTSGSPHVEISNCHFNGKRHGLITNQWRAILLSNNDFYAGVGVGDEAGATVLIQDGTDAQIVGNKFEHAIVAVTRINIEVVDFSNLTISSNTMKNTSGAGMTMSGASEKVVVTGNTIIGYAGAPPKGIYNAATGDDFVYSGNFINNFTVGIYTNNDNNLYVGNDIKNCTTGVESVGGTNNRARANNFVSVTTPYVNITDYDAVKNIRATATVDPSNIAAGARETIAVTVTGSAVGDFVNVAAPYDLTNMDVTATVSAADTVSIYFKNNTAGAIDLASGTWNFHVYN